MGKTISEGVVSGQLKVHGVSNLRVIDASVFPIIPDCRIQSPTYMTAEKVRQLSSLVISMLHLYQVAYQQFTGRRFDQA